jgi:DNA (cytosine-5)-methyltransferase 1
LSAADYGVPQVRRRLFVIGASDGARFSFPEPTHISPESELPRRNLRHWLTAWDALHDLPEPNDEALKLTGKWADLLPSIPEGQNYLHHTERGDGEPLFGWRRRYWSFLLKLAKDQPAWTLQAQPGPATGPFHWSNRRLSMREMARLQTFPDDFEVLGSVADAQRQLGNAVPALLAEILAREIRAQLLRNDVAPIEPKLTLQPAGSHPDSTRVGPVPTYYLRLRGDHAAHPGTGRGYRAKRQGRTLQDVAE